jgi:DNA polymerase-1
MLDDYVAKRYTHIYTKKRQEIYNTIQADKNVKRLVKSKQKDLDVGKKKIKFEFNPGSFAQLQLLYYTYYKMPVVGVTETGAPTTKSSALKQLEGDYPILQKIRYYKLLSKMLSTYLQPAAEGRWKCADGRVRTTYNLHGTRTGRLSSGGNEQRINLQNIPTPEKEPNTLLQILPIKNVFTHSYMKNGICRTKEDFQKSFGDGYVMSVDYSGMELRVFASLAKCYPMLEIHKSGRDFHSTVAIIATMGKHIGDVTDEDIDGLEKSVRYRYKWTNWTLLYGGGRDTLVRMYGMTEDEAEAVINEYYSAFPEVLDYRKKCIAFAEDNGYIESPFGRREKLYYIADENAQKSKRNSDKRASVNMPVQSAASDTLLVSAVIIDEKLFDSDMDTKLVNTVHDSLMLDVPKDEIEEAAALCTDVMENVTKYAKDYMPALDMSWLISPLKADVEVGSHYGSLISLEELTNGKRS